MLQRIACGLTLLVALALPCSMSFFKSAYHKNRRSTTPLFRFEEKGKAGFIDEKGKVVIPPKFDVGWFAEEDFVEELSPARRGENWGFIDVTADWVIPPTYWRVQPFSEGLAAVTRFEGNRFQTAYIDKRGATAIKLLDGFMEAGLFSEGLAAVRENGSVSVGKLGYIDRSGTTVIPYQFADGGPFHEGLAAVIFDGQCYIEARDGSSRGTPPSVPGVTSCGGVPSFITQRCGEGFINKTGKMVFRFDSARDFSEGFAAVEQRGKWGFIAPDGKFRIEPQFEAARSYSGGLAAVKREGKWGYVDSTGQWIIQPQFHTADDFSDSLALTDIGYIDKSGNKIASAKDGTAFVQGLAHVALSPGEFGYIDHLGKVVFRYRPKAVEPSKLPYSWR
jgi:hypothetical protein